MYCGAAEFVCAPDAVRHIPVLVEECMGFLEPGKGGVPLLTLPLAGEGIVGRFYLPTFSIS